VFCYGAKKTGFRKAQEKQPIRRAAEAVGFNPPPPRPAD